MAAAAVSHVTTVANQIVGQVLTTLDGFQLQSHLANVLPFVQQTTSSFIPYVERASVHVLPYIAPYAAHVEPYMKGALPHLQAVPRSEVAFIVGGLLGGIILLQLFLLVTAKFRSGANGWKAFTPTVFWLLLCTLIHSWIEMMFVYFRKHPAMINGMNLYGAADTRYGFGENLELEPGTRAMEAITALITGPLCLLLAWAIVGNKSWRWGIQVVVSTCQMYGLTWFMWQTFFLDAEISAQDPFMYWVLFVGFNAPWGIIPPILLAQALFNINKSFRVAAQDKQTIADLRKQLLAAQGKTNGTTNGAVKNGKQ